MYINNKLVIVYYSFILMIDYSMLNYVVFLKCEYLNDLYLILATTGRCNQRLVMIISVLQKNVYWGKMKITFPGKWVCVLFSFTLNEKGLMKSVAFFKQQNFSKTSTVFL